MRALRLLKQEDLLFFDIETASIVKEIEQGTPLWNSWEYKVNKDGEMSMAGISESFLGQAGLNPEFAKVVSIVVGKIVDDEIVLMTFDDKDEATILNSFNNMLERNIKCTLTGFANQGFDTPFLFKRCLINGIIPHDKLDNSGLKPWECSGIDLAEMWKGTSFTRASLINIATAFGLPSPKDDISGADVGKVYWSEGQAGLARISAYCRKDVETTINIFRKMRLQEALPLRAMEMPCEVVEADTTLLDYLFNGAAYGAKEKKILLEYLKNSDKQEREEMFAILDALTSTASGKKTKITKAHVKGLREEIKNV